jgi:ATP-dependent exoDNAse (exonuclease V) alpha subunit
LNYTQTNHSMQGMTINDCVTIFDAHFFFVTPEWLYTAVTRADSLNNVYFCFNDDIGKK